ncbi:MAG TPA: GNAT family N-acetyltransferase [Thermoleophilaceae bacterium]|nr:GNAT family N-acetyltransferase [Thermoleophilaceae bacterium]
MQIIPSDDVNAVVRLHRQVYEAEFGLDPSFAQDVATRLAELRRGGFPGPRDGLWLAELDREVAGSITLNEESRTLGQLGHLVLLPEARGTGAGRRLVVTVLDAARAAGYERLQLFTFGDLTAAGSLYRSVGFEPVSSEDVTRWGRRMDWQRYELTL